MQSLTTLTPYWGRPEMFREFEHSLYNYTKTVEIQESLRHMILLAGESQWDVRNPNRSPAWFDHCDFVECEPSGGKSIGHYHNIGAVQAKSDWIMKLDVDCLFHPGFFISLFRLIETAKPRQWFNIGMLYMPQAVTAEARNNWGPSYFDGLIASRHNWGQGSYKDPAGSNFVCRREDYLAMGGCDPGFVGYGWEDYYQMLQLERNYLGKNPLSNVTLSNVTQKCRDEISRRKAMESFQFHPSLCLLHQWHPVDTGSTYRNAGNMARNKMILFRAAKTP